MKTNKDIGKQKVEKENFIRFLEMVHIFLLKREKVVRYILNFDFSLEDNKCLCQKISYLKMKVYERRDSLKKFISIIP